MERQNGSDGSEETPLYWAYTMDEDDILDVLEDIKKESDYLIRGTRKNKEGELIGMYIAVMSEAQLEVCNEITKEKGEWRAITYFNDNTPYGSVNTNVLVHVIPKNHLNELEDARNKVIADLLPFQKYYMNGIRFHVEDKDTCFLFYIFIEKGRDVPAYILFANPSSKDLHTNHIDTFYLLKFILNSSSPNQNLRYQFQDHKSTGNKARSDNRGGYRGRGRGSHRQ
jgi:hypothetical protein